MVKVTSVLGLKFSGQLGKTVVFANWKGVDYMRAYAEPSNPNTPAQQAVRGSFTNAVDKWHTFNTVQRGAYGYLASGEKYSGYNLFVSRWQKRTPAQRSAYVAPYVGFLQLGSGAAATDGSVTNVTDTPEATTADKPIVIGSVGYTKGSGTFDPYAVIDIVRGRIDILKNVTGALTISYVTNGKTVTDEAIADSPTAGQFFYTDNLDIDYQSVVLKAAGSEIHALEVDILAGKFYAQGATTFTGGSTITFDHYTPAENVKLETTKVDTTFITFRGYSDANGLLKVGLTSEDGDHDVRYQSASYASLVLASQAPASAAADQYVALTPI